MNGDLKKLCEHRMQRAKETLQEGLLLLEKNSFNGAINRFYYAAFYGARALLASKGFDSSKHSGIISLFHQHFVRSGEFDSSKAKALSRSFEERQDSDYEDFFTLLSEEVYEIKGLVASFIEECEQVLSKMTS